MNDQQLEQRVQQLEGDIKEIKHLLIDLALEKETVPPVISQPEVPVRAVPVTPVLTSEVKEPIVTKPVEKKVPKKPLINIKQSSSWWLNKVGIGLLLLGLAFLFKYSVDQGWLTEEIRTLFGVVLGIVLAGIGIKTHAKSRHFAQVLFGGAIASWYITVFAAFNFYELVSYWPAVGLMVCITLLGYSLAIKYASQTLAVISVIGGLLTPFVLVSDDTDPNRLMVYTAFIVVTAGMLYFIKGWRVLLWVAAVGALFMAAFGLFVLHDSGLVEELFTRIVVQVCLAVLWLTFVVFPLLRRILAKSNSERWNYKEIFWMPEVSKVLQHHINIIIPINAFIITSYSLIVWGKFMEKEEAGLLIVGVGVVYTVLFYIAHKFKISAAYTTIHHLIAMVWVTVGMLFILDGNHLLFALSAALLALLWFAQRYGSVVTQVFANVVHIPIMMALFIRFVQNAEEAKEILFTWSDTINILTIGTLFAAMYLVKPKAVGKFYMVAANALVLIGLTAKLSILDSPFNAILLVWLGYGVAMHVWAHRTGNVVAKYFSHSVYAVTALMMAGRFIEWPLEGSVVFNLSVLTAVIGIVAWFGLSQLLGNAKYIYQMVGHWWIFLLAAKELSRLSEEGTAYVTVAWGVQGITMLVYGLMKEHKLYTWLGTMVIVVMLGKLFLVDLGELETIWRVILFMGFGGLFLVVSFFIQKLVKVQGGAVEPATIEDNKK